MSPREASLDFPVHPLPGGPEVAVERMSVEGVDDDRGAVAAREPGGHSADRARLRRVSVKHVRSIVADQVGQPADGPGVGFAARPLAGAPGSTLISIPRRSATKAMDASPSEIAPAASVVV